MPDIRGGLREKTSTKTPSGPLGERLASVFTSSLRGKVYIGALLVLVYWFFFRGAEAETDEFQSASLSDRAYRLTTSVTDEDVYGPPVEYSNAPFKMPETSAIQSLHIWGDDVPPTRKIAQAGGWSLLENVVLKNGTLYIIAEDRTSFLDPYHMFSTGAPMLSEPSSWAAKDPTPKDIQIISPAQARNVIGPHASRLEGVTLLCNDNKQFVSHYYHFIAEIFFGLWRTYSVLDLNIEADGSTSLAAPRRFMLPRVEKSEFDDYTGLSKLIARAVFPAMSFEFSDTWADRGQTDRPFILDRVVIGDRVSAEHAPEWNGQYKYVAPAFTLPGSSASTWWSPVRRGLVQFLGQFRSLESSASPAAPVITYISRQQWNRRMLNPDDHKMLVKALEDLRRRYGFEINVVEMEKLGKREQLSLAVRTTVMLGVHGNGLTHSIWMDPRRRPVLMEFFADNGFSTDYEYPMRQLGIEYFGWWGGRHFGRNKLPEVNMEGDFQGNNIRVDGKAVAAKIVEHIQSTQTS